MYIGECGRLLGRPSRSLTDLFSLYHSLEDVVKTTVLSKLKRSLCFFRIFLEMFLWFVRSKNKLWSTHFKMMTGFFFLRVYKAIRYFPVGEPVRTTDKLWKSPSVFQDYFFGVSSKSWASACLSVHLSYAVYRAYRFLNWETKTPGTFLVFSP